MYIGVFLCGSGLILGLTLLVLIAGLRPEALVSQSVRQFARFILISAGLSIFSLVLFIILSVFTGILPISGRGSYSLPQDYQAYGLFGSFILLIGLAGMLSPVFTAVWLRQQHKL